MTTTMPHARKGLARRALLRTAALAAGATLIDEWVTPAGGLGLHFLADGAYHLHIHAATSQF